MTHRQVSCHTFSETVDGNAFTSSMRKMISLGHLCTWLTGTYLRVSTLASYFSKGCLSREEDGVEMGLGGEGCTFTSSHLARVFLLHICICELSTVLSTFRIAFFFTLRDRERAHMRPDDNLWVSAFSFYYVGSRD